MSDRAAVHEPPPQPGSINVGEIVMADIQARIDAGYRKYGTYLQTDNGRDALWDLYQELIDATMYIRQAILERDGEAAIGEPETKTPSQATESQMWDNLRAHLMRQRRP